MRAGPHLFWSAATVLVSTACLGFVTGCETGRPPPQASPQAEQQYPWPGTEHVAEKEAREGPLQR